MKVAIIGQKGIPALFGGIERHVEELSVRLAARGHNVTVYTRPYFTPANKKTYRGVHLVSLRSIKTKHLDAITHTINATLHAVRGDFDIIHFHGVGPSLMSFIPRILGSRAKVVSTFHCVDRKHQKWGRFARVMLRAGEWASVTFPHKTIAVSRTIRRYCRDVYGRKILYIPNGVPMHESHEPAVRPIHRKYKLTPDQYVVTVSRLIQHKGIHYLIDAFRQLKTNKKLVIVGDGFFTDEYVKQLHAQAAGDERIVFTGFQRGKALEDLFTGASLFVLPSENEGLPIALLEAASHGICVLASDIPENREVFAHAPHLSGYTFRSGDVNHLREQLNDLLRKPKTLKRVGAQGKQLVAEQYNWDDIITRTERLYATLAGDEAFLEQSWRRVPIISQ